MNNPNEDLIKNQKKLFEMLYEKRRVDLVNFGESKFFVYIDDMMYDTIPASMKNYILTKEDILNIKSGNFGLHSGRSGHNVYDILFNHYWNEKIDFTYIDVGCPYGITAIINARTIRRNGHENKVICFEPGLSKDLIPFNIKLNNMQNFVKSENLAVTDNNLPSIMWSISSHTEGNRIVNRDPKLEDRSFVVNSTTLDEYIIENDIKSDFIIKIDTEGAENEVLSGMSHILKERYCSCIWEFSPNFLSVKIKPIDFLSRICINASLYDLGQDHFNTPTLTYIPESGYKKLVSETLNRPGQWTDILVIPQKIPGYPVLHNNLLSMVQIKNPSYPPYSNETKKTSSSGKNIFQLGSGWYDPDKNYPWMSNAGQLLVTSGKEGKIGLKFYIPLSVFEKNYNGLVKIDISLHSNIIHSWQYSLSDYPQGIIPVVLDVPKEAAFPMEIFLNKYFIPKHEGINDDTRMLGMMLLEMK